MSEDYIHPLHRKNKETFTEFDRSVADVLTDLTETKRIKDLGHLSGQGHVYDAENEGGFLVYLYKEGERAKYDGRKAEGKRDGYVVFIGSSAKLRTDIKSALEARV